MNRYEAMQIFVRVAELSSFTKAGESLSMPKATVSNAISELEELVGARLLQRTTRKVQLTQDGLAFYERSRDLLADVEELETMFQQDESQLSGRLRVDMPVGVARNILIPRLPEFLHMHPRIELELSTTDRRVDPVREGFDCVLRIGGIGDANLIAKPLGEFRQINCASPEYLEKFGTPETLEDLAQHRLIHYLPSLGSKSGGFEYCQNSELHTVSMAGAVSVNNSDAYQAACVAGLGIIQAPEVGMRPLLESGRLRTILPNYCAPPLPVTLLYVNRRHLPKRTRRFMEWVEQQLQDFFV